MSKAQNKTVQTSEDVAQFLNTIADESKRMDCFKLATIMQSQSGFVPKMWGPSIVGFGSYHYKYESGREGDAPLVAFSPRKAEISLYLSSGFEKREELLQQLGKHKSAKACIYIKRLQDINTVILEKMISNAVKHVKALYK